MRFAATKLEPRGSDGELLQNSGRTNQAIWLNECHCDLRDSERSDHGQLLGFTNAPDTDDEDPAWSHSVFCTYGPQKLFMDEFRTVHLPFLATCRQIYGEGTDVFYGENEFAFIPYDRHEYYASEAATVSDAAQALRGFILDRPET